MPLLVWISLALLLLAVTAGSVYVFLRVRTFLRSAKSVGTQLDGTLRDLTASADRLSANLEELNATVPRLEASVERLERSLARAAVLQAAVQDAKESLGRLSAVYPRK
jgi:outer membrane murein-binding lipoprotein Lpp